MAEIEMANTGLIALVDDEDYPLVSRHRWISNELKHTHYGITIINNHNIQLHRFILGSTKWNAHKPVIDHINHNGLDNRKENLRWASYSENAQNRRDSVIDGLLGVTWIKSSRKWAASIGYKGKSMRLGKFDSAEDAARAYDKQARFLFGKHATVNFESEAS